MQVPALDARIRLGMNNPIQAVAANVRALRTARGLTVDALASASGVGKATLSRVEAGQGNPTVETLMALADALGVSFGALATDASRDVHVLRVADAPRAGGTVNLRLVDRLLGAPLVEVLQVTFPPRKVRESSPHPPGVVEHVVLTTGRLRVGPVDDEADLNPGDVMRFAADVPHRYRAIGNKAAEAVLLMVYPTAMGPHASPLDS